MYCKAKGRGEEFLRENLGIRIRTLLVVIQTGKCELLLNLLHYSFKESDFTI